MDVPSEKTELVGDVFDRAQKQGELNAARKENPEGSELSGLGGM